MSFSSIVSFSYNQLTTAPEIEREEKREKGIFISFPSLALLFFPCSFLIFRFWEFRLREGCAHTRRLGWVRRMVCLVFVFVLECICNDATRPGSSGQNEPPEQVPSMGSTYWNSGVRRRSVGGVSWSETRSPQYLPLRAPLLW